MHWYYERSRDLENFLGEEEKLDILAIKLIQHRPPFSWLARTCIGLRSVKGSLAHGAYLK